MSKVFIVTGVREYAELLTFATRFPGENDEIFAIFDSTETAYEAFKNAKPPPEVLITGQIVDSENGRSRTGSQLIKDCKSMHPRLRVVLATAVSVDECRRLRMEAGDAIDAVIPVGANMPFSQLTAILHEVRDPGGKHREALAVRNAIRCFTVRLAFEVGGVWLVIATHQELLSQRIDEPEFRTSLENALSYAANKGNRFNKQFRMLAVAKPQQEEAAPLAETLRAAFVDASKEANGIMASLKLDGDEQTQLFGWIPTLRAAFAELLLNAMQSNKDPKITVAWATNPSNELAISISDNGPGLTSEEIELLRLPGQFSTKHGALGLGIAVARNVIEMHGGQLELTPESFGFVRIVLPQQPKD